MRARGVEAWSCDTEEAVIAEGNHALGHIYHLHGDVLRVLDGHIPSDITYDSAYRNTPLYKKWDIGVFFPVCTYLCSSGLHWNKRVEGRAAKTEAALAFVERLMRSDIHRISIENPRGCITTRLAHVIKELGFVRQSIQPYEFGDDASKETILLLKNLPPLVKDPAKRVAGRMVDIGGGRIVERWSNQTDSGQNKLSPSDTRAAERGKTYGGIADAMGAQWSRL